MDHTLYFDGNNRTISWVIENNEIKAEQMRVHAQCHFDKFVVERSKYIALHVGIFWSIGKFIIKNGDKVRVMLDLKSMFEHLAENKNSKDSFMETRTNFIRQLISQRALGNRYQLIEPHENCERILLSTKNYSNIH